MRDALVAALTSCAERSFRNDARRFLSGLSSDELQFIAEFLGACMLESGPGRCRTRAQLAEEIAGFQRQRSAGGPWSEDQAHKMILLLEYLCRGGSPIPLARAANA